MKGLLITIIAASFTVFLTVVADSIGDSFKEQRITSKELLQHAAVSAAFSANADARLVNLEKSFTNHIADFKEFEKETRKYWEWERRRYERENGVYRSD